MKTLGCRLNEAELESWTRDFHKRGHQLTRNEDDAELIVINTCAVTAEAVKKSRKLLRRAKRENPHAKLIVSGCYVSLEQQLDNAIEGIDLIIPNTDKNRLVDIAHEKLHLTESPAQAIDDAAGELLFNGRQRAFVKVQDGCRYRCTYCIVTLARGEERSRTVEDIIQEIQLLQAQDIKEVVITGVHLGGYGSDLGINLADLIKAILNQTDIERIRLGSLEPWELHDDFWQLFENPRLMPHLHLPLQSGCDTVLRRMSRRCRTEEFAQLCQAALRINPDFNITTDIIVGFPGETEAEWQQGLSFIKTMPFGHIHIFAFSPRQGTKAAILPDPVSRETKRDRSQVLHEAAADLKNQRLQSMSGKTVEVLFEGNVVEDQHGNKIWSGYAPNFFRVSVISANDLCNQIKSVKITGVSAENELNGELV